MWKQLAFSRLDEVHEADSTRALLDVFDALSSDFGVLGFALTDGAGEAALGLDLTVSSRDFDHFEGRGLLASVPHSHCLVLTTDGPRWETAEPPGALPRIRRAPDGDRALRGIVIPVTPGRVHHLAGFLTVPEDPDQERTMWLMMLADTLSATYGRLAAALIQPLEHLSAREREVLEWLAAGKSTEDAGAIIGISAATVMFHYRNVAQRLGTLNRTHTVVEAMRRGLLPLGPIPLERKSGDEDGDYYVI